MRIGEGGRRKTRRRGQPAMPKRRESVEDHPFRKTTSGFESLIPRGGAEDFFFSLLADPDHAAEFFERGDDQDPLLADPRVGIAISAFAHIFLVLFFFIDPSLGSLLDSTAQPEQEVAEIDKEKPLLLFIEEPPPPPVAAVPVVPVVPVPDAQPTPPEPQANENALLIPKAMLEPERRAEVMDDLPFSTGNTDEFYTDEEVKDPGEEGDVDEVDEVETEPVVAEESGEDDVDSDEVEGADDGNDAVEVADSIDREDLGDLLFRDSLLEPTEDARREEARKRRIQPPEPRVTRGDVGDGGENGRFTDIRRFLASARFHHPEGGLVVGRDNTLYYNDKGANFVPWIRRMLAEVRRTWIASMPYAAMAYGGHTAVGFTVARDGTVIALETIVRSDVAGFDNNAEGAIRGARLLPLPSDYPDETFDIVIVFWVNERPYDIFG